MSDPDNQFDDELVSANPNQRNWRGILIALLVIAGVLALIVTSVALLTPPDDGPRVRGRRLRLQDLLSQDLAPVKYNATWISGEDLVYRDPWGGISLMHAGNLSTKSLMSNTTFRNLNPVKFSLSADRRFLLLAQNVQKLYRHSYLAQYSVYDTLTTESYPLTPLPDDAQLAGAGGGPALLLASWTPRGHGLLTVRDYDIYFRPAPRSSTGYRLTDTARPGVVQHGVPDWLYEEEILQSNSALWMSADGHLMLYATFNDTLVEEQHYPWYGAALEGEGRLYPEMRGIRYPKPGTRNPVVTLTVADLADPKHIRTRHLTPPAAIVNEGDHYFTSAQWISLTEVCVVWLNRAQNLSVLSVCKSPMWFCQETYRITADSGWAEPAPAPLWSSDGAAAVTLAPLRDGPAGLYRHAVRVPRAPHAAHAPLTHGRFEVTRLLAWDHRNHHIYYLGIPESAPGQQHLYRVSAEPPRAGAPQKLPYCVTCAPTAPAPAAVGALASAARDADWDADWDEAEVTTSTQTPSGKRKKDRRKEPWPPAPQPCLYHDAHFSPTAAYFVLECLGPTVPTSALYRTALPEPRLLLHMQNNTVLKERLSQIALPAVRTFAVQISGGYAAQVRLLLPPGLREDEITRYPLVLLVYGAPGTQLVTERWRLEYASWLAGSRGAVVASVDGRGSAGQGLQLVHEVHRRLGTVDVADQLEVTEYLRDSLHFIDPRRVAVWGWSYGGFVAALALASPLDVFHCGIAIAPVVSWRLYDSAYAERYMGAPNASGSYAGYAAAEVTRQAARLRDKPLLIAHGAADDNVHLQHSMALARALADKGAVFRQQIYPDEGHSLSGVKKHLYRSMTGFLEDCFRKQVPPESKAGLRNGGNMD